MKRSPRPKASAPATDIDPTFLPVAEAFAGEPQITTGKMMASFGLKVSGKIFAMHVRGKLVAKLPKSRVDELVKSGAGTPFDPRRDGRVMKEWIAVAPGKADWLALAREAHRFVKANR